MDSIEPDALYDQRGDVSWSRPLLQGDVFDGKHYATRFVDVTAAPAELLTPGRRIATLSNRGIYVLQQRPIKHYTRFEVDLGALRSQSAPVLEEAQQQWDWIETVLTDIELNDEAKIEAEGKFFDAWLGEGDPSRRLRLQDEVNHTDIRREAQRAAAARARERDRNSTHGPPES